MSARLASILAVAFAAAMLLGGCMAAQFKGEPEQNNLAQDDSQGGEEPDTIVQFREAVNMVANLEYEAALPKLLTVSLELEGAGDRDRAAEAMFWLGFCHEKLGHTQDAQDAYVQIIRDYPSTKAARQAGDRLTMLAPTE